MKTRAEAARVLHAVIHKGSSLSELLPAAQGRIAPRNRALLQELCYGTLRWHGRLNAILRQLLQKPLKGKQKVIEELILVGLYQLLYTRIPDHAAVTETVNATQPLGSGALRGLVNGVLRNFMRNNHELCKTADHKHSARFSHPDWLLQKLQQAYPDNWQQILDANNQKPPMWVRVDNSRISTADWLQNLRSAGIEGSLSTLHPSGVCLDEPVDVETLPGFNLGECSIQDGAAQLAARLLAAARDERILDACAAPGGKTLHILESQPQINHLVALDSELSRLERLQQNLARCQRSAEVICGDASQPERWNPGGLFDRILLDAPCSATGVIRRHPDIRWLRRSSDIEQLAILQAKILDAIWTQLKPGGTLLYATCSVLPEENSQQIERFLARTADASLCELPHGTSDGTGWQILPGEQQMDGFYYAKLKKNNQDEQ